MTKGFNNAKYKLNEKFLKFWRLMENTEGTTEEATGFFWCCLTKADVNNSHWK